MDTSIFMETPVSGLSRSSAVLAWAGDPVLVRRCGHIAPLCSKVNTAPVSHQKPRSRAESQRYSRNERRPAVHAFGSGSSGFQFKNLEPLLPP